MASPKPIGNQPEAASSRLKLRVTAAAEKNLRAGHPWLFAESIREQNRPGSTGELGVVYDKQDRFLAIGLFDADSPIRLRVLQRGRPKVIDADWWAALLEQALLKRQGLFDTRTTGFRWINGESDGWPGLVLDRYAGTLVLKLYTAAWLPRLPEVLPLMTGRLRPERVVLRLSRNIQEQADAAFHRHDGEILHGPPPGSAVVFSENGLLFEADVLKGQKTGFFLDQRENRQHVATLARGRSVLNGFSFSGGFSLYAARGGASSSTDLDISPHALAAGERNFALNHACQEVAACRHEQAQGDAFEWLAQNPRRRFDLIVLDPPSLARKESERLGAIRAYSRLATLAIPLLSPGGILVACSCTAHVTAEEFFARIRAAAATSKREFSEIRTTSHAPDHPATFKEAQYLKAIYLAFEPRGSLITLRKAGKQERSS